MCISISIYICVYIYIYIHACMEINREMYIYIYTCTIHGFFVGLLGELPAPAAPAEALRHPEDELLFGRAGYVYALLWARPRGQDLGPDVGGLQTANRRGICREHYARSRT